jgi:hypothetical protein
MACARRVTIGMPALRVGDRQPAQEVRYLAIGAGIAKELAASRFQS